MATVPAPRTWTVGELLTASKLNADLRDGLSFLLAPPLAILTRTALQAVGSGSLIALPWDTEVVDRDGGHSTSTNISRYTAQTAGYYSAHHWHEWPVPNTTGYRRVMFRTNGSTLTHQDSRTSPTSVAMSHLSGLIFLAVNDYVEVTLDQNSGSSVNIGSNARLDIVWAST